MTMVPSEEANSCCGRRAATPRPRARGLDPLSNPAMAAAPPAAAQGGYLRQDPREHQAAWQAVLLPLLGSEASSKDVGQVRHSGAW